MLTALGCRSRRRRLFESLPLRCDVVVLSQPESVNYLTGFFPSPFEFRRNESGAILILTPDRAILVADNLLRQDLDQAHVDEAHGPVWYEGRRSAPHRATLLVESALARIPRGRDLQYAFESASVPAGLLEALLDTQHDLPWIDLQDRVRQQRRVKDADELVLIRRAIAATDAGMAAAMQHAAPGMTEFEVFRLVQDAAMISAGEAVQVYGDFVSGPRCEQRGGPPSHRRIEPGDLLLLDFSVVVRGYRGDVANTFQVGGGPPSPRVVELYEACLGAVAAGEAYLRPGVPAREVDAATRGVLARYGLASHSPSHMGHGLGLGHPEPPYIVPESTDTLQAGEVVTLEPGVYIPGVAGMRFERNYLITPDGFETLSSHPLALVPPLR